MPAPGALDAHIDYSGSFGRLRGSIVDRRGTGLIDFIKTLQPRYWVVYRDIALGYGALASAVVLCSILESIKFPTVLLIIISGTLIGYWIAYLQLFLHEGAHWNLARDRETSDRLGDILIGLLAGIAVKKYRLIHFQHHRALGTVSDSEHTYFFPLNIVFLVKNLFGIRVLEILRARRYDSSSERTLVSNRRNGRRDGPSYKVFVSGIVAHIAIICGLIWAGFWATAAAWVVGVAAGFPFFAALRQLLEHRSEEACSEIDYTQVDHGAVARIFGDGLFASTFGAAGFNRHLLHHWEPTVSYTRLADLERFLADTQVAPIIRARKTTYGRVFWRLARGG